MPYIDYSSVVIVTVVYSSVKHTSHPMYQASICIFFVSLRFVERYWVFPFLSLFSYQWMLNNDVIYSLMSDIQLRKRGKRTFVTAQYM